MSHSPGSSTQITADVTNWATVQRVQLLDLIDSLSAAAQAGLTGPVPAVEAVPAVPAALVSAAAAMVEVTPVVGDVESSGWTHEAYLSVMTGLLTKHYVQAAVIMEAIKTGTGYVSREKVYELGQYPDTRSLKGFTRPVNRVTSDLVDSGALSDEADDLLRPDYDPAVKSFQRAKGFFVPMEVVKLALEIKAASEASKDAEGQPPAEGAA